MSNYRIIGERRIGSRLAESDLSQAEAAKLFKCIYREFRHEFKVIAVGNQETGQIVTSWPDIKGMSMTVEQFLTVAEKGNLP